MKKLSMLTAALALAASSAFAADTYGLHSSITGNPNWETVDLTDADGDGWYEYTGTFVSGNFGIKKNGNWLAGGGANITEEGKEYDFNTNGGDSNSSLEGNYTFGFNPTTNKLRMVKFEGTIAENVTYQLRGTIGGGEWTDYDLTETDGVWSKTFNDAKAGSFGIKKNVNGSQKDWIWGATGSTDINEAGEYKAEVQDGSNGANWASTLTGKVTFSFNPETKVLTVATEGGDDPVIPIEPEEGFKIYWDNSVANWETPHIHYWGGKTQSTWPGVAMTKVEGEDNMWVYEVSAGTTGCLFNAGNGNDTKTSNFDATANHYYTQAGDQGEFGAEPPVVPEGEKVLFDNSNSNWAEVYVYIWKKDVNNSQYKAWPGEKASYDSESNLYYYLIPEGGYNMVIFNNGDNQQSADLPLSTDEEMVYTSTTTEEGVTTAVASIESANGEAIYFNLQGQRVAEPAQGLYIRVANGKSTKVIVR